MAADLQRSTDTRRNAMPQRKTQRSRRPTDVTGVALPAEQTEYLGTEPSPAHDLNPTELRQRDAQIALIALGYLDINTREIIGDPRGEWGTESRQALTAFSRDHELAPVDELDAPSYRAILAAYDAALEGRPANRRAEGEEQLHH
jgi:hypothetical protein